MKSFLLFLFSFTLSISLSAQEYFQLADYNPGTGSIDYIIDIGQVNNKLVYSIYNESDDESYVYVTDGTVTGTELLLTIPTNFGAFYFSQYQTENAVYFRSLGDIWKYDGNNLTTVVEDVYAVWMTEFNGELYYIDESGDFDKYLAKATNDPANPEMIYNLGDPLMTGIAAYNGELYMFGEEGFNSPYLFKSDGTAAGTTAFYDLEESPNTNRAPHFMVKNGFLYFFYQQSFNIGNNIESELYRTDGTEAGTVVLGEFMPGNSFDDYENLLVWNDGVLYAKGGNPDVDFDTGLWRSDGQTTAGTYFVSDLNMMNSNAEPKHFVVYNGLTYFTAKDEDGDRKIFRTDGTLEGTYVILDDLFISSYGSYLTVYDGNLVIQGRTAENGRELYFSDGTPEGTYAASQEVAAGNTSFFTDYFIPFGNNLMFLGFGDNGQGREVWIYNNGEITPTISLDLTNITCNDNGTPTGEADDFVEITLNVSATGGAATYNLNSDAGTPTPAVGTYGQTTTFSLPTGSAGSGNISLVVSDASDESLSTQTTIVDPGVCSTTSIEELNGQEGVLIAPNPFGTQTEFRLQNNLLGGKYSVTISSVAGTVKSVLPFSESGSVIFKSDDLNSGIYYYRIVEQNSNKVVAVGRIVKIK